MTANNFINNSKVSTKKAISFQLFSLSLFSSPFKFTKAKNNRNSVTLPSSSTIAQDVSKENKVYPNHPNHQHPNHLKEQWENIPSSSSASCSSHHPNQDHKLKQRQQNLKNSSLNKSETKASAGGGNGQQSQQQPGHSRLLNQKSKLGHSNFSKKNVLSTKKKKVLCETTSVTCVTTTTSSVQTTKLLKDHHHQVPRKKIKVSQSSLTGASVVTTTIAGSSSHSQNPLSSFLQDQSMDSQSQQLPSYYLNSDLDLFVGASNVSTSDIFVDDSLPCCSKSINYHHQKSPSSLSNSSCSSQSNIVGGATQSTQLKITNFLPVKKHTKVRKTKFGKEGKSCSKIGVKKQSKKLMGKVNIGAAIGGSTNTITSTNSIIESDSTNDIILHETRNLLDDPSTNMQASLATSNSNLVGAGGSKLLKKKKRTLKTETTNLKIKKSRCKRLLH